MARQKLDYLLKACTLVLLLSLLGCASGNSKQGFFAEEEPAKKPKIKNQTRVENNWRVSLGGNVDQSELSLSPALLGDAIYAVSTKGNVYRVDAESGDTVWKSKLKKVAITAGVGVGDGLVLVGSNKGVIYALNQDDGAVAWQQQLDSEILATPVSDQGVVVARTTDGKVYGLKAYDGEIIWTISRQMPKLTLRGDSKPLVTQGVIFAGFPDGTMAAIEQRNGRALWDLPISFPRGTSEIDRLADVDTTPLLIGNFIYVTSYQEVTHALNIAQRRIEWSADVSSFQPLDYDAAYLYVSDKQGVVHQIDRANGDKLWSQEALKLRPVSAPMSVGPYVMVADGDGDLFVFSKQDGRLLGRHRLGAKSIVGEPVVNADTVYFVDTDGDLRSVSVRTQ